MSRWKGPVGIDRGSRILAALLAALACLAVVLPRTGLAQSPPLSELNAGLNDAWFNPDTAGQGFFIVVYPDIPLVFLAWFTYDLQRPANGVTAMLGEPGHRWVTAQGPFEGNSAELDLIITRGGVFDSGEPAPENSTSGTIHLQFPTCASGTLAYDIPGLGLAGEIPIRRIAGDNIALCEALAPQSCERAEPDLSHGPDNPPVVNGAIIPASEAVDGGVGADGIPAIDRPKFTRNFASANMLPSDLVVGTRLGGETRAYPHDILNWHEIVNDDYTDAGVTEFFTLSYCPLTGSAMLWKALAEPTNKTFGTSGLLFNSNLVLYDRASVSFWSQMLEQAVAGPEVTRIPDRAQVVETTWETWRGMYPDTVLLTEDTGFTRDYDDYPYGNFRENQSLLFPANNSDDRRLHRKERVLGLNVGEASKVWPISRFTSRVQVLNETVGNMPVVVAGSKGLNFGVVYNRELEDCTVLEFQAVQDRLPVVMRDGEGNEWDVFGTAVSGPRTGQQLQKTNSYIAFWYAWTAFFPGAEIHP